MRFKQLLLPLSGLISISAVSYRDPTFNSTSTLYRFDGTTNLSLPVRIGVGLYGDHKITVTMYNAKTEAKLYTKAISPTTNTFNISLPIKNRLKADGLRIQFEHYISGSVRHTNSGVIYPYKKEYINVNAYRNEPFIVKGVYLRIKSYEFLTDETFDFTELNEYLSVGANNKLDFSYLRFKYDAYGDYSCGDIYLHIKDYKNVFPHLQNNNQEISIKMKYEQNEGDICLSLDQEMYVNKTTLEMYASPYSNTEATSDLFIPAGKEEDFADDDIYITMEDSGYSLTDFTLPFNFYYSKKYFGECYNSDFCIEGGIKE